MAHQPSNINFISSKDITYLSNLNQYAQIDLNEKNKYSSFNFVNNYLLDHFCFPLHMHCKKFTPEHYLPIGTNHGIIIHSQMPKHYQNLTQEIKSVENTISIDRGKKSQLGKLNFVDDLAKNFLTNTIYTYEYE